MTRSSRLSWLVLAFTVLVISPTLADDYIVYGDAGIPPATNIFLWCGEDPSEQGLCPFFSERFNICDSPEGNRHLNVPSNTWAGFGMFYVDNQSPPQNTLTEDLSAFAGGDIRFFVSTPHELEVGFQCDEGGGILGHGLVNQLATYGWDSTPAWQEIVIPVADFYGGADLNTCLQNVSASFTTTGAANPTQFKIDHIRWRKPNSHAGASSVTVVGRQLMVNGKPFVVNGVAYSPHSIGENFTGGFRDRPDLYADDFSAIAGTGANAVRTYSAFLTTAMLDEAWANGLFVIPTFGIDTVQLQCDAGRAQQQARLEDTIQEWKDHPALLYWILGNEVAVSQSQAERCDSGTCTISSAACATEGDCASGTCSFTTAQTCNPADMPTTCPQSPVAESCIPESCSKGWYAQLDTLAAAADVADPSHPTGASNPDVGDIGVPGCTDDAALASLDLWGMNLYRGCTFANALSTYRTASGKPLVITEFGSDAWNSTLSGGAGAEDQAMQQACLASLLTEAEASLVVRDPGNGVTSGQVVFAWMDEWWKSFDGGSCTDSYWDKHDSCEDFTNPNYTVDPAINEEWWGIATMETFCSDMTTPCTTDDDCPGAPGTCAISTGVSCRLDSECPGTCSATTTQTCVEDSDCPGLCSGNPPTTCANDSECSGPQVCIFGGERCEFQTCDRSACGEVLDPTQRVLRSAYSTVSGTYQLGAVLDLNVVTHNSGSGATDITFVPGVGAADHALHYGPLGAV
ncbi:MAG: hypothetical protein OEV00_09835, partial [Acidobacteriota bacterium]|nr:hypothetical protein [Acidobacteriota bacterium]